MYYVPIRQNIHDVKSKVYIASYMKTVQDEYLNQKKVYATPHKFFLNVQPISTTNDSVFKSERLDFGQVISGMKVATIPNKPKYLDKFKEFDLAYLDGATPDGELENGDNANYVIYSTVIQNTLVKVYFRKLVK